MHSEEKKTKLNSLRQHEQVAKLSNGVTINPSDIFFKLPEKC